MIKIYVIAPNSSDMTSLYRAVGPYGRLREQYPTELDVDFDDEMKIGKMFACDILVMQRPFQPNHIGWIEAARSLKKKIIVDYDDNVLAVPKSNPHSSVYGQQTCDVVKECLKLADVVTVSTQNLKDAFLKYNSNIKVIPNAIDLKVTPFKEINWEKKNKTVIWRGGESHTKDLLSVMKEIKELTFEVNDWSFIFFGGDKQFMNYVLKPQLNEENTAFLEGQIYFQYVKILENIAPSINITPLEDNIFNQSKSNIAWLETTIHGAATVVPNMNEWDRPGITLYNTPCEFKDSVLELVNSPALIKNNYIKSANHIKEQLDINKVNKQRFKLIKSLL